MKKAVIHLVKEVLKKVIPKPSKSINHAAIIRYAHAQGRLTARFIFMVIVSSAVSIMGLLQSSPAVIIGAMLISPLMLPIMALGFGLSVMDLKLLRKSLKTLFIGTLAALLVSFVMVKLTPLDDPTTEILARTSPNLLDLFIAIFSALAGGYAVIKRKGETLAGVAIATALMPPLTVVGYGLATDRMAIASGSFFLYMTNLLAIALTVTSLAIWYGFGYQRGRHHGRWQLGMVFAVFSILSIPLGNSLKHIAYEAMVTRSVKDVINGYFAKDDAQVKIESFRIAFGENDNIHIDAVILTQQYHVQAQEKILAALQNSVADNLTLSLDQLVISHAPDLEKSLSAQNEQNDALSAATTSNHSLTMLRAALPIPADITTIPSIPSKFMIYPKPVANATVSLFRQVEQKLNKKFATLDIEVTPPISPLPDINFATGKDTPDTSGIKALEDSVWALKRWGVQKVRVIGFTNAREKGNFDTKSLAYQRVHNVARYLEQGDLHPIITLEHGPSLKTQPGKADNRRVKIQFIFPKKNG